MKEFCENTWCETRAVKEVPVSVRKPSDQTRSLCATCAEVYTWGVQHGRRITQQGKMWILAIADKGIIAQAQAYHSKAKAERGVIAYLREYERYDGGDDFSEACRWLTEHDERLSVEIFEADTLADAEDNPEGTANLFCFMQKGGFVVLAKNRQDADTEYSCEAWAYNGPLDFQAATPVTFGLGTNSYEAIDALNSQLSRRTYHDQTE